MAEVLRLPGTSIPPSGSYPGLLSHDLGNGREIVVIGSGEEAEAALQCKIEEVANWIGGKAEEIGDALDHW